MISTPYSFNKNTADSVLASSKVAAYRKAFDATMTDPVFLADAKRLKLESGPATGPEVQQAVAELYGTPQDLIGRARAALK